MHKWNWRRILRCIIVALLIAMAAYQLHIQEAYRDFLWLYGDGSSYGGGLLVYRCAGFLIAAAVLSLIRQRDRLHRDGCDMGQWEFHTVKLLTWSAAGFYWLVKLILNAGEYFAYASQWTSPAGVSTFSLFGHVLVLIYGAERLHCCWGELRDEWTVNHHPLWLKPLFSLKILLFFSIREAESVFAKWFRAVQYCFVGAVAIAGLWKGNPYYTNPILDICEAVAQIPVNHFWVMTLGLICWYAFLEKDD